MHRIVSAHENYGNKTRTYTYDSLGNLTYETEQGNKSVDYKLNNLNQITTNSDDGWKTSTAYTYDNRGNLTQEAYTKNKKVSVVGSYIFDETNKMVSGTNASGEVSNYIYNGLGALVENQWIITKNGYGYHDVDAGDVEITYPATGLKKSSTVVKQFVVDYTSETFEPLMEYEVNGFDYRYVYGNDRLSVDIKGVTTSSGNIIENGDHIRLYYHMDYLGTADYLTSPVSGKITSWTHYNEWGEITHNAVLKCGQRELDMVKRYATHDYDSVLGMYYAKARFYDAELRRFDSVDPVKGFATDPTTMVQYLYVKNSPLIYVDENGEIFALVTGAIGAVVGAAVGAYKSYKSTGSVKVSSVVKGAAVGAVIGIGAGAVAGAVLAGSATASTAAVAAGASKAAATVAVTAKTVAAKAAAKVASTATAVGTAINQYGTKVVQGVQKVAGAVQQVVTKAASTVNSLSIKTAAILQSQPGVVGTVSTNAILHPQVAVATAFSGVSTVGGAKQTYDYIVAKDYKNAAISFAFTAVSAFTLFSGCKALSTPVNPVNSTATGTSIKPKEIRFSQNSVNGAKQITESMKADGWNGEPIDVVVMSDGKLTTVDNTRLLSAGQAGINVQANIHSYTDAISADLAIRFKSPAGILPTTWGDAVTNRILNQTSAYRNAYPNGSYVTGWSGN